MQALPGDDQRSPPVASTERLANSSQPRRSWLKHWAYLILTGLLAGAIIRVCLLPLASRLSPALELSRQTYAILVWSAAIAIFSISISIAYTKCRVRRRRSLFCYCLSQWSSAVTGLLLVEYLSDYRGTTLRIVQFLLSSLPALGLSPQTALLIAIHSTGVLLVAVLGYSIHAKSRRSDLRDNSSPTD